MGIFWLAAILLCLLAVFFVLWPLRSRMSSGGVDRDEVVLALFNEQQAQIREQLQRGDIDQQQCDVLIRELELSLLDNTTDTTNESGAASLAASGGRKWLIGCAVLIPVLAFALYWHRGYIPDLQIMEMRQSYYQQLDAGAATTDTDQALKDLIAALERRVAQRNNDGNRYLLARAQMQQGDFGGAIKSYTGMLQGGDPPAYVLAELAQAIFLATGNRVSPEVDMLVQRALQMDPQESTALGLAGISAFQKQQFSQAIDFWRRAIQVIGVQSAGAQSLLAGIERAQSLMTGSNTAPAAAGSAAGADQPPMSVDVSVSLADDVSISGEETLFVYVRAWQGPKMPLAIARYRASQLPLTVTLDESMAMTAGMTMSQFPQLEVIARISSSNSPMAQPGDWQATSGPLPVDGLGDIIQLSISERL